MYTALFHWRYVCLPPQRLQTFLFYSFCFFLSASCFYLIFKVLLPFPLDKIGWIFYLFLALFPYKILFPADVNLCSVYTDPSISLLFGLPRYWAILLYALLSTIGGIAWGRYYDKKWRRRRVQLKEIAIAGLLLCVMLVQTLPRIGNNSPLMVMEGIHREKERCMDPESSSPVFFGHCADGDRHFWGRPNGIFKGVFFPDFKLSKSSIHFLKERAVPKDVIKRLSLLKWQGFVTKKEFIAAIEAAIGPEQTAHYQQSILQASLNHEGYKFLVANRRAFTSYLYSLVEPLTHPYYGTIIVNCTFFYLILLAGYRLVKLLRMPPIILLLYPLLLSGHARLLQWALETVFYSPKIAFVFFLLVLGYTLGIYSKTLSFGTITLFCSVLACSALVYDPHVKIGFIGLWGLFSALGQVKRSHKRAAVSLGLALLFAIVPLVAQESFETLLESYDLAGNREEHADASEFLISQLPLVPGYLMHHFWESVVKTSDDLVKLMVYNAISEEYLGILGLFGVICAFSLLPAYLNKEHLAGISALYFSSVLLQATASFIAQIPPATYAWVGWTGPQRSGSHLLILVLAQCLGLFHLAHWGQRWLPAWLKPRYPTYVVVLFICIFSFHKLLILY